MTLKTIKKKRADAQRLRRAEAAFTARVVPALEKKLAPFLAAGERMPDLAQFAVLAVRRVGWLLEGLEKADFAHLLAEGFLALARDHRRNAWARLGDILSGIRDTVRGVARRPGRVCPGLGQPVPHPPWAMLEHARRVLQQLRAPKPALPRGPGVRLDPAGLASVVEPAATDLQTALQEVEGSVAAADRTRRARTRAMAVFEADHAPLARILADLGRLGGGPKRPGLAPPRRRDSR